MLSTFSCLLLLVCAALSGANPTPKCDLAGEDLLYGEVKTVNGQSFACLPVAVAIGPFVPTQGNANAKPTVKAKTVDDPSVPKCILPDGSELVYGFKVKPVGDKLYRCTLVASSGFCLAPHSVKVPTGETFDVLKDGSYKCAQNTDGSVFAKRISCYNEKTGTNVPVDEVQHDFGHRAKAVCTIEGMKPVGCVDHQGSLKEVGNSWKVLTTTAMDAKEQAETGIVESCVTSKVGAMKVKTKGCLYGTKTLDANCFYRMSQEQTYVSCLDKKSRSYVHKKQINETTAIRADVLCTKKGPELSPCIDQNGQPRLVNDTWLFSNPKQPELGYIVQCYDFAGKTAVTTIGCYYYDRLVQSGCYFKLKSWSYVGCEPKKYSTKAFTFNTLLSAMMMENCGNFAEKAAPLSDALKQLLPVEARNATDPASFKQTGDGSSR